MPKKFRNQYRIKSSRLSDYDYNQNGIYFVTICTKNKEEFFGKIKNGKMILNDIGKIVNKFWKEIPKHFPFVKLDIHQIMPNHIHGNLEIIKNDSVVETHNYASLRHRRTKQQTNATYKNKFGPQSKNLASIIRGFKSSVKRWCNENNQNFAWQPRFYDRIVRNDNELNRIKEYILANPQMWKRDRNNIENLWM